MSDLVLVFDDETDEMQDWWDELRDAGLRVAETTTTSELVAEYHAAQPDLIILDRMPGGGNNYAWQPPTPGGELQETLLLIHRDIRRSPHLRHAPIIVFTNYYDRALAATLTAMDRRILMLGKDTVPSDFREKALHMIERHRYPKGAAAEDHPDRARYHVRCGDAPMAVRFEPCVPREHSVFRDSGTWRFQEIFAAYLDGDAPQDLLKCVVNDETERVLGLLYLGGPDNEWIDDVTFEAAPNLRYGAPNRPVTGVGTALMARVVMEFLHRENVAADTVMDELVDLPRDFAVRLLRSADFGFFEAIGLRQDSRDELRWWIDTDAARSLLKRVLRGV